MEPNVTTTWDQETVNRMMRLKRAHQAGMFREAFDDMFPSECTSDQPEEEQQARQV
jgi:hypothetical protein